MCRIESTGQNLIRCDSLSDILLGKTKFIANIVGIKLGVMASDKVYRVIDSGSRGMIAVAARDIKAGELVVEETEPIMFFTQANRDRYKNDDPCIELAFAGFDVFRRVMTPEQQQKFLTLYGPTTGPLAANVRDFLTKCAKIRNGPDEEYKNIPSEEVETMVKVLQVTRLNMFGVEGEDYKVYAEITRFSHSCASNCQYLMDEKSIVCYARRTIPAGEELTISYNTVRDMDPIHDRRLKYLEAKEFTCHCPRCDAIGDDTRQFDCFDPKCKGVMMVCQPINKKKVRGTNLAYTDVKYVEPHLLPCTVCHRAAPTDYQAKMFKLEETLLEAGPRFHQHFSDLMDEQRRSEMEPLYQELLRMKIPSRHAASLPLLHVKWRVLHMMNHTNRARYLSAVREAMMEYQRALENIVIYPGHIISESLTMIADHSAKICIEPVFPPDQEKVLCCRALQMHVLFHGRNTRDDVLDEIMLKCHEKLSSVRSIDRCAFCEETPQRAALTLSRCGRCLKVAYCSAGCQKAHWKLHRKECKSTTGGK